MRFLSNRKEDLFIFRLLAVLFDNEEYGEHDVAPVDNRTVTVLMAIFAVAATMCGIAHGVISR